MANKRKFSIKQLAAQAGVSKATVDRVIHQRGQVSYQTQQRVKLALIELQEQQHNLVLSGRTFHFDILVHAPHRFTQEVRVAVNQQLTVMSGFRIKPRFHFFEEADVQLMHRQLLKIAQSGSQGVILKAANDPLLREGINELASKGIAVVTLVTDIARSKRLAYVGIDNQRAGQLAAYLFQQWLKPEQQGHLLVVMSKDCFRGEQERVDAFQKALADIYPALHVVLSQGSYGVDTPTYWQVMKLLKMTPNICGVYSVGGANTAILQAFSQLGRVCGVFIGHDLDCDNKALLAQNKIQAILHHDLNFDIQQAFRDILQYQRVLDKSEIYSSKVEIITPFNIPY